MIEGKATPGIPKPVALCGEDKSLLQKTAKHRAGLRSLPTADDKSCNENDHKHHTARDGNQQDGGVGSITNDPGRHWNDKYMRVTWGGGTW